MTCDPSLVTDCHVYIRLDRPFPICSRNYLSPIHFLIAAKICHVLPRLSSTSHSPPPFNTFQTERIKPYCSFLASNLPLWLLSMCSKGKSRASDLAVPKASHASPSSFKNPASLFLPVLRWVPQLASAVSVLSRVWQC
jgi:hypothetical protein